MPSNNNKDRILSKFLSNQTNRELIELYLAKPSQELRDQIDSNFKNFYLPIRLLAYFIKTIHFEVKNLDKKRRKYYESILLVLDKQIEGTDSIMLDLIEDYRVNEEFQVSSKRIEDYVSDPSIIKVIQQLSKKQKEVLYFIFVKNMKLSEVATILNVTQQNVSKIKNTALQKMKKELKEQIYR